MVGVVVGIGVVGVGACVVVGDVVVDVFGVCVTDWIVLFGRNTEGWTVTWPIFKKNK